jgi:hypothetical protein
MKIKFIRKKNNYDGSQLISHWIYNSFSLLGDAALSFIGPCQVKENLIDLIDRRKDNFIYSPAMLHFIVEHFGVSLKEIVLRQRILVAIVAEEINFIKGQMIINRKGNDLFYNDKKLSVSIATVSRVSGLIHLGLNISLDKKVPVDAACLTALKIKPEELAKKVLQRYAEEQDNFKKSLVKVRSVD